MSTGPWPTRPRSSARTCAVHRPFLTPVWPPGCSGWCTCPPTRSWTEEHPLLPNSPYAASKASADLIARSYWRSHGLHVSITRCSNNYGPHQHPEKLIPRFVTNLLRGMPVPLYGDGRNVREWLHVDDHCRALHSVLTRGGAGEIYNIGRGNERTNRQLTDLLVKLCDADPGLVRSVPDRKGHDLRYALDDTKICRELGYTPAVPFERGITEVVTWYRENPNWWNPPVPTRVPALAAQP